MTAETQLDPAAEAVLRDLRAIFAPHGNVNAVQLNAPEIIEEFRPASVKDTDLASVPKPALNWAFGAEFATGHGDARICALVFTSFARLQAFYAKNSGLHGTLVTCWHGAAAIWLRATGRVPGNFTADGVRWCLTGIIPIGCPAR